MADERVSAYDPVSTTPEHLTETAARDTGVPIERIVAHLAERAAPHDPLATFAEPTWDDLRTVMARAGEPAGDLPSGSQASPYCPSFVTPQAFYAEMIRRPDIRRIFEALDD